MNKYAAQSRAAQRRRRVDQMCTRKRAFDTEVEAAQKGQRHYHCPHCRKWHRSGSLARLAAKVAS